MKEGEFQEGKTWESSSAKSCFSSDPGKLRLIKVMAFE